MTPLDPKSQERRTLEEALTPDVLAIMRRAVEQRNRASQRHAADTRPDDAAHAYVLLLNHQARSDELAALHEDPITYFCPTNEAG